MLHLEHSVGKGVKHVFPVPFLESVYPIEKEHHCFASDGSFKLVELEA